MLKVIISFSLLKKKRLTIGSILPLAEMKYRFFINSFFFDVDKIMFIVLYENDIYKRKTS